MARAELLAAVEALRLARKATRQVIIWTDCMFVINGFARVNLSHADLWVEFWKAHDAISPPVQLHKAWRSHATEAGIAAGLISPLEACGNEVADKLASRGAQPKALSMEYAAATRSTDLRVRLVQTRLVDMILLHVQNRTKTVHAKAKAPERRAKFDPAEAMSQLNRVGHDFSRVQVGKGRFTYKCRLCFLRGERAFLKQLLGKPCSATSRNVLPLPAPVATPTPGEPESLFIGDTPSSEEDPFGWGGDFDQDHRATSDQRLPLSPDKRVETTQVDFRLSGDHAGAHMIEDAVLAVCAPGTSEVLCGTIERAESCQGHVEVDDVAAVDSRDFPGTMDYTRDDAASAVVDPGTASPTQPRAHSGAEDNAEGLGAQTTSISNPATMAVEPTPGAVVVRNRSRSPRRLEGRQETFRSHFGSPLTPVRFP